MKVITTLLLLASLSLSSAQTILALVSGNAVSGGLSSQDLSVLASLDQRGSEDDSSTYIEVSPNASENFIADFLFEVQPSDVEDETISEIKLYANSIGAPKSTQTRYFQLRNYATDTWVYLGDNRNAPGGVWLEQSFTLTGAGLSQFVGPDSNILMRYRSNNAADASNLDYLAAEVTTGTGTGSPPAPAPAPSPTPPPPSDANGNTYNFALVSSDAVSGGLSNQDLSVLATLDQRGTDDDSSTYVEVSPNAENFIADFLFEVQPNTDFEDGTISEFKISANSVGAPKSTQTRYFQLRNYAFGSWLTFGDNSSAQSWIWQEQAFTLTGSGLSQFVGPDNNILIRYRSNNAVDVSNLDYLAVEVTTG